MYHEEQWIDGKLYWREAPDAEWKPYSYKAMYQKYVQANKWANELYERLTHLRSTESPADSPASPVQQRHCAIKAICEQTDPHETDIEVLRSALNKIYAALNDHTRAILW
jgi:hypothetical protein